MTGFNLVVWYSGRSLKVLFFELLLILCSIYLAQFDFVIGELGILSVSVHRSQRMSQDSFLFSSHLIECVHAKCSAGMSQLLCFFPFG